MGKQTAAVLVGTSVVAVVAFFVLSRSRRKKGKQLQVEVACNCGQSRFQIKSTHALPLVCYCDDCQGYVKWLTDKKKSPNAHTVMNENGGVRVCQVFKAEISEARENSSNKLQWTVLDPKLAPPRPQIMFRGHATCCHTPIFSACWREVPTVGFFTNNVVERDVPDMPPPAFVINTTWAKGEVHSVQGGHKAFPPTLLLRFLMRNFILYRDYMSPCAWELPDDPEVRYEPRPVK